MPPVKWTIEKLTAVASKYTTRMDFVRGNPQAYGSAARRGLLDQICAHMIAPRNAKIADNEIIEKVKQFDHISDFRKAFPSHYQAAHSRGMLTDIRKITKPKTYSKYNQHFAENYSAKFILNSEYVNSKTPVNVTCKSCGSRWNTIPFRIRCASCGYNTITAEQHDEIIRSVHGNRITPLTAYINRTTKINYKCDQNHTWSAMPHNVMRGSNCPECSVKGPSKAEKQFAELIASYGFPVTLNSRDVIKPYELDIYIPSKQLAIEFNGVYWHSKHPNNYHLNKTKTCETLGIRLIHVWEHETNNQVMHSIIRNALGMYDTTIEARKCKIETISWKETKQFLDVNHIQGAGASTSHNIALVHNGSIVAIMTFGRPRFQPITTDWELIRYAVRANTSIVGGAFRLWAYRPSGSIVTYSDRRLFDGRLYTRLGFEKTNESQPGYFYINQTGNVLLRYQTQRKKLPKLLGDKFNPELSEFENMSLVGYMKIFDCGTVRWTKA